MSAEIVTVATSEIHVVTMGQQGPQGPVGPIGPTGGSALSVYAGEALGGNRIVVLDGAGQAYYATNADPTHFHRVLGMTLNSGAMGEPVSVIRNGEVIEPSWNWTLYIPVFLGTNGLLTQTQPSTGFSLIVGFPVTTTKLFVSIREPIALI